MSRRILVRVGGKEVDVTSEVAIGADLDDEMVHAPGQVAYWGSALAEAQFDAARVDSEYRSWRAQQTEAILDAEPKLAEWKVKARMESYPEFLAHKKKIAETDRAVRELWAVYEAFLRKVDMLRSKGARERAMHDTAVADHSAGSRTKKDKTDRVAETVGRTKDKRRRRPA